MCDISWSLSPDEKIGNITKLVCNEPILAVQFISILNRESKERILQNCSSMISEIYADEDDSEYQTGVNFDDRGWIG